MAGLSVGLSTRVRDVLLALSVAVGVAGVTLLQARLGDTPGSFSVWSWALLLGVPATLVVRRRFPAAVAVATLAGSALYYTLVGPDGPIVVAFVVALYSLAAIRPLAVAVVIGAVALAATAYGEAISPRPHLDTPGLLLLGGWIVASVALGRARRAHVAYLREAEERAATEERLRIARELHDVLGHNLSLINVQASAALHRLDADPGQAGRALTVVKEASRDTLRELRGTLGVLRRDEAARPPGLAHLDRLIEQARATGLTVVTEVDGEPPRLAPDTDLAAYRLVQEALTNVRKHAGASTATVRIRYTRRELRVEVTDDGAGGGPMPAGNGIKGMSERVRALGGDLSAGSSADGGFRVSARLPQGAAT
ncbi:sensor histidine kinase [Prauserella muralis]|uniref:histidine kinase n=1 Tax=Prauserella muralis TaxID=588067 RepID=A0A2V4B7G5_9PSEU|nr:sensor histidine kinase [Prauserella muralis]PXY31061.1 hypothetical protein BAY60_01170 [Prauserella muralis]